MKILVRGGGGILSKLSPEVSKSFMRSSYKVEGILGQDQPLPILWNFDNISVTRL